MLLELCIDKAEFQTSNIIAAMLYGAGIILWNSLALSYS